MPGEKLRDAELINSLDASDVVGAHMETLPELTSDSDFSGLDASLLPASLSDLELLVRRELDLTRYPAKSWVLPQLAQNGERVLDTLIVGGGQAGFAACFGLMRERVTNVLVIDENPEGAEGPWGTYARMPTMRTHKEVGGIEFGIPSLSFRAWYEVSNGPNSWRRLYKVPTDLWRDYLVWYRRVLGLPVRNDCRLIGFEPSPEGFIVAFVEGPDGTERLLARTLVFATGMEGNGVRHIPDFISANIPRSRWSHTQDDIDFEALGDKVVAVLGGGASAYDNAIVAAERGAVQVHLYHRQRQLTSINPGTWTEFNGYLAHFADLSPEMRWRFTRQVSRLKGGPPQSTLRRAANLPNLHIHAGFGWDAVRMMGEKVAIDAADGSFLADHLILGTGYRLDLEVISELADHLPKIALWRDVFVPSPEDATHAMLGAPYLGSNFEFLEKRPGQAPWLGAVFNFSRGAQMSMGVMPIGLSGIKFGVPRLVQGVTKKLFVDDAEKYLAALQRWQQSDLTLIDT